MVTVRAPVDVRLIVPDVALVSTLSTFIAAELNARLPAVAVQPVVTVSVRSPVIVAAACAERTVCAVIVAVPVAVSVRAPVPCSVMVPAAEPVAAASTRFLVVPVVVIVIGCRSSSEVPIE